MSLSIAIDIYCVCTDRFCGFKHFDAVFFHLSMVFPELAKRLVCCFLRFSNTNGAEDISKIWKKNTEKKFTAETCGHGRVHQYSFSHLYKSSTGQNSLGGRVWCGPLGPYTWTRSVPVLRVSSLNCHCTRSPERVPKHLLSTWTCSRPFDAWAFSVSDQESCLVLDLHEACCIWS